MDTWGCKASMIIGGTIQSCSLAAYWLAATSFASLKTSSSITVPTLCILGILIFMSNSLVTGSVFKLIVTTSCKGSGIRGSAVGVAKGYLGLGAGTYACLFDALRKPKLSFTQFGFGSEVDFLVMAGVLAVFCIVLPAFVLLPNNNNTDQQVMRVGMTSRHFGVIYIGLLVLALTVMGSSAVFLFEPLPDDYSTVPVSDDPSIWRAVLILIAWLGPILTLLVMPRHADSAYSLSEMESFMSTSDNYDSDDEYSLVQMLHTVTAWLLCYTCTILVGSGTIITNQMGQEVQARHFPARAASGCLAMFSVAQSMARVLCGALSEWAFSVKTDICGIHQGVPRPFFLVVASAVGVLAHSVLAAPETTRSMFVLGVAFSGIAFGMVWPLMVLIVGEVFGTSNHGANYMFFDGFTSAIGTLLVSNILASAVYEAHTERQDEMACYGSGCFQWTHIVIAVLCGSCVVTSVAVMVKSRDVYGRPTDQTMHRRMTDELLGSPYMRRKKQDASHHRTATVLEGDMLK